jgi:hypothetical protein
MSRLLLAWTNEKMYISDFLFWKLCHRQTTNMSRLLAWTSKKIVLRIIIFETLSQRFFAKILRDFQKLENTEIGPIMGHIITGSSRIWPTNYMPSL